MDRDTKQARRLADDKPPHPLDTTSELRGEYQTRVCEATVGFPS